MIKKIVEKVFKKEDKGPEPDNDYIVGASTGMHGPTPLARLNYVASKGVDFAEIASEHPAVYTKNEIELIKTTVKSLGMKIAIHAGTTSPRLTGSYHVEWRGADEEMKRFIDAATKLKAKYLLFHSCMTPWPELEPIPRRYDYLVDESGKNIIKKITKKTPKLKKWFLEEFIPSEILSWERLLEREAKYRELSIKLSKNEISEEEFYKERNKLMEKLKEEALKEWQSDNLEKQPWRDHGKEKFSYEIMGRWMAETRDPIWKLICGNVNYEEANKKDRGNVVAAIAAKYIWGHIKKYLDTIQEKNLIITLEAPPAMNQEWIGFMKIVRPKHLAAVCKTLDSEHVKITIDFEHLATHGLGPEEILKNTWSDIGRYVCNLHIGMMPTASHQHVPVPRGDIYTYKILWELRKKGMRNAIFIFEVGGGDEPRRYEQIIVTLKDIAFYLSKDVPPEELPEEFFGLTPAEMEHEKRVIDSHAFDPLQGMFELPELSHTWLGREAMEKKRIRPETWQKEEHR